MFGSNCNRLSPVSWLYFQRHAKETHLLSNFLCLYWYYCNFRLIRGVQLIVTSPLLGFISLKKWEITCLLYLYYIYCSHFSLQRKIKYIYFFYYKLCLRKSSGYKKKWHFSIKRNPFKNIFLYLGQNDIILRYFSFYQNCN